MGFEFLYVFQQFVFATYLSIQCNLNGSVRSKLWKIRLN